MAKWFYIPVGSGPGDEFGPFRTREEARVDATGHKFTTIAIRRAGVTCDKFVSVNKVNYRCVLDKGHDGKHMARRGNMAEVDTIEWE